MARLTLPSPAKINSSTFRLQRLQAVNQIRSGDSQAVDLGEPIWVCEIETTPLSLTQGAAWKALIARLRGAMHTLMLYDTARARPLAYRLPGADAFARVGRGARAGEARRVGCPVRAWGAPRITEVDRANSRVRVDGFVAGATISVGDMACWDDGVTRRLHMVVDAATADGLGQVWLLVEPAPPVSSTHLPAALELERPCGEFRVLSAEAAHSAPVVHQVKLQAVQTLRRG